MGLLDYIDPDALKARLQGLLGGMPLTQALRGEASVTADGLRGGLLAMKPFDASQGAQDAYGAALGALSVGKMTKFEKAHKLAQKNAALPVEQGGLGLPKNNTAADRAKALGFEGGWAHGSPNPNIQAMSPSRVGAEGPGSYATNHLPEASTYALGDTPTVYPLMVKRGKSLNANSNPYDILGADDDAALLAALRAKGLDSISAKQPVTADWLASKGVPIFPERTHYVSMIPQNFRSRFAAFDPKRKDEADLLAAYVGIPIGSNE